MNRLELEIETIKSNKLYDNAFEWRFEFPEILDDKGIFVGFDVVIGNPPWVSLMGKYKGISDDNLINLYKSIYPYNTYMPNLYEYFIKHSYNLLKDNGYFIFITPDRVAYNEALGYIRKILLTEVKLIEVIFRWDFPDIIADTITIFYKKEVAEDYSFRIKYSPAHKFVEVNSKFYANPESNYVITPFKSNAHKDLLIKILSESTQLMKFCKSTSGFGGKSSLITSKRMNENQREVAKGESIARYETRSFFFFEIKDENITGRTRDISKLTKLNKILIRKTGSTLQATLDDSGVVPEQSLYFLYDFNISSKYLLALINSSLLNWVYINYFVTNIDSTPQLKNYDLDNFPIKVTEDVSKLERIEKLVDEVMELKKLNKNADTNYFDAELNTLIYKIYNLSDDEIALIEQSNISTITEAQPQPSSCHQLH